MKTRPALTASHSFVLMLACLASAAPAAAQDSFGGTPPQQQQQPPPASPQGYPPGTSHATPPASDALARQAQAERQDSGVAATAALKSGSLHGPTPNQLPGGRLVTTEELMQLVQDPSSGTLVFDVLGGPRRLPNAIPVVPAAQGGSFEDSVQREFGQYLEQVTQGRKNRPMVFYCQSAQCWMSYNAALRATRLGYTNVLWYRGGIEAWQQAGQALAGDGMPGG